MALISDKLGIASVGIACQTAHQIRLNHLRIARLSRNAYLEEHATPFDWLLVGARSAGRMIGEETYFPVDFDGPLLNPKPFWPRFDVHFWHAKTQKPEDFIQKHAYLACQFDRLRECRRRIFMISNTQNNVGRVLADREGIETRLFWDDMVALHGSIVRIFGHSELHVVTREGLDDGVRPSVLLLGARPAISVHKIGRDGSQWAGNGKAWSDLFERIIP